MIIEEIKTVGNMVNFQINKKLYVIQKACLRHALNEVGRWQNCGGSGFSIKLIELIAKADKYNKEKIIKGFPEAVCAYLLWYYNSPFKKELFED